MANVDSTLNERGKRYGEFKDHARIAQALKDVMRSTPGWSRLSPSQKESMEMQAHKQARILNGDPNYADSWHDIGGYTRLIEQELEGSVSPTPAPAAEPPRPAFNPTPLGPIAPASTPPIQPVPDIAQVKVNPIPSKIPDRPPGV